MPQPHIDWRVIVDDLIAAGLKQVEIAAACGCSQSSVSDIRRGFIKCPNYEIGSHLLSLHKGIPRKERKRTVGEVC